MMNDDTLDVEVLEPVVPLSSFVNRLSWSFIIVSGMYAMYILFLMFFFQFNILNRGSFYVENNTMTYDYSFLNYLYTFYLKYQGLIELFFFLGVIMMLVVAIGLWNRRKLARVIFIKLLYLHVFYTLLKMTVIVYFAKLTRLLPSIEPTQDWSIIDIATLILIVYPTYGVILYFLYRWIHRKLNQPAIIAEFTK